MTQVEVINKMVKVFDEISYLQEDLKTIKANAKEAGMDPTMLAKVAKAISDSKSQNVVILPFVLQLLYSLLQ